jgi:murein DD-endopeptidase MepM/ murein hydrolase activator NlpD
VLVASAATALALGGLATPAAASSPPTTDLGQDNVADIPLWLPLLRAPATPLDWSPGPGAQFATPVRGALTQPFGCTGFQLERQTEQCPAGFHTGIDLADAQGTPIHAAGDGLAYPFDDRGRYGIHVVVQHRGGFATVYGHMVEAGVRWGQPVKAGDVIGWVGTTGNSTGPHLHFEVRFAGIPLDPAPYLLGSPPDPGVLPNGWPGAPPDDLRGIR